MTEEQALAHQRRIASLKQGERVSCDGQSFVKVTKPKFRNIRCQSHDGINFASRLERDYYEQLHLRWKAGDVRWFTRQVPFWLEGGVKIIIDFMVVTDASVEFVDTKGFLTPAAKNKLKQLKARYGIDVTLARAA